MGIPLVSRPPGALSPPKWWSGLSGSLPLAFTFVAFIQLALVEDGRMTAERFLAPVMLAACAMTATWLLQRHMPRHDRVLLPLVILLIGWGLAEVDRLAPTVFLLRQTLWMVLGSGALLAAALFPHGLRWLERLRYTWLLLGLFLLGMTFFLGVNPSGVGARLWLGAAGFYFQPSELLKLLMVVFLASYLAQRQAALVEVHVRVHRWRVPHPAHVSPLLFMWGFSMLLLLWQRDLGAAVLFFGLFLAMFYAATGQGVYVLASGVLLIGAGVVGYHVFDVVALRVDAWLDPWRDASGRSFQIVQALLAFASGGVLGQGLGQGLPSAIPVVHTDFVFAAVGEEYGLIGTLGLVVAFMLLVSRAFRIALGCQRMFERLLAVGIGALFGLQALVIMAGTLKLIPLTGVTLPFVSYGGSSLLVSMTMVGLLLRLSGRAVVRQSSGEGKL
ncbi:MAG: FtsW/RodA/SpoVE family cell cycle protein [Anaerolineae bacterium]|nr:FtsW/RodA/SpoVE family cell cycle protein [Anaerolineae bacterium]MDW8070338.1 FtsW/RodA/SpoVE family cell cycle protein [Anaerolineae bacterium]